MLPEPQARPTGAVWRFTETLAQGYVWLSGISGQGRRAPRPINRDLAVRVVQRQQLAVDVVAFDLERVDGLPFPPWDPGAHIDVCVEGLMRQYSLTGDPDDLTRYRIAIRRIESEQGGRGGSVRLHQDLAVGTELTVKGPRNAFPFIVSQTYFFVAGGIGITPILPMVREVIARSQAANSVAPVDWRFVYAGRSRASMPFLGEVEEISAAFPGRVVIWPDDERGAPTGRELIEWAPVGAALYTCGPPAMIEALRAEIPAEEIDTLHYERFSAPPVLGGEAFTWVLPDGSTVEVGEAESALTALLRLRPGAPYSCQQGFCGTCVLPVQGQVEHRDKCLTPSQREGAFTPCVSRGIGRIETPRQDA